MNTVQLPLPKTNTNSTKNELQNSKKWVTNFTKDEWQKAYRCLSYYYKFDQRRVTNSTKNEWQEAYRCLSDWYKFRNRVGCRRSEKKQKKTQQRPKGTTERLLIRQSKTDCANFRENPLLQSHKQYWLWKRTNHLAATSWVLQEAAKWIVCF